MKKQISQHSEYYEAILQIRPAKKEVLDYAINLIEKRNDTKISKLEELKTGFDLYLTNQRYARGALAQQLKRRFGGKVVITKALYGQHKLTSKLVYRATVLFRIE